MDTINNNERTIINDFNAQGTSDDATRVVLPGDSGVATAPNMSPISPMPPVPPAPVEPGAPGVPAPVNYSNPAPAQREGGRNHSAAAGIAAGVAAGAALGVGGVLLTSAGNPDDTTGAGAELPPETPPQTGGLHDLVDEHVPYATTVNDSMSFSQAFAAARAEVGAGGCFEWHGQLYGTYYKNEWDNMSAAEKHEYNDHFAWSHGHGAHTTVNDDAVAQTTTHSAADTVAQVEPESTDSAWEGAVANGDEVSYFDVDGDGVLDVAGVDVDGDGIIDQHELVDITDYNVTVDDLAQYNASRYSMDDDEVMPEPEPEYDGDVVADFDDVDTAGLDDITADIEETSDYDLESVEGIGYEDIYTTDDIDVTDDFDLDDSDVTDDFDMTGDFSDF